MGPPAGFKTPPRQNARDLSLITPSAFFPHLGTLPELPPVPLVKSCLDLAAPCPHILGGHAISLAQTFGAFKEENLAAKPEA